MILRRIKRCRDLKKKCIPCVISVFWLSILQIVFKFERWHVWSGYSCSPYKKKCVDLANEMIKPSTCVEIGCGLGDIITRIQAKECIGLDISGPVIKAASFYNFKHKSVRFIKGSLEFFDNHNHSVDLLIAINWMHMLDKKEIIELYSEHIKQNKFNYIMIDESWVSSIHENRHNFGNYFPNNLRIVYKIPHDYGCRDIVVYKNTKV